MHFKSEISYANHVVEEYSANEHSANGGWIMCFAYIQLVVAEIYSVYVFVCVGRHPFKHFVELTGMAHIFNPLSAHAPPISSCTAGS